MDPITAKEGFERFSPRPRIRIETETLLDATDKFVKQCHCGQTWTVSMERGEAGRPGCVHCSCGAELVSWSGTVIFTASAMPSA